MSDQGLLDTEALIENDSSGMFDRGHQGDVDYTQIVQTLRLTPEQRLERHEGWRLFVKEALRHAGIHQGNEPA